MKTFLKLIQSQNCLPLKSQGQSMSPILQPEDVVYFKKISFSKIKVNDLIVFRKKNQLISHRVVYKTKDYLITKGDNSFSADGKIKPWQILGKIYRIKRNGQIFNPDSLYLLQSTYYFSEIVKIKNEFDRQNINYVFLKGLPLHLYFEKTHPRRIYLDCDVLVAPGDFDKAQKILFQFGYKKAQTELTSLHKKLKDKKIENAYYKIINGAAVVFDLHLEVVFMMTQLGKLEALYPQKLIDRLTGEFLKTKRQVKIDNQKFWILNFKFLILYLALHFFHHNFGGGFRLAFLDRIIRKVCQSEFTWTSQPKIFKQVQDEILRYQLQNFLYPVFVLLKKYYKTPLPPQFFKKIQPTNLLTGKLANKIIKKTNIFDDEPRIRAGINRFKNLFFLSPQPLWRKFLVFFNRQVLYSLFWVLWRKLKTIGPVEKAMG